MIRPQPATWFEVIAARDDVLIVLEALARTGAVELESPWRDAAQRRSTSDAAETAGLVREFAQLASRFRPYWPALDVKLAPSRKSPTPTLTGALEVLRRWGAEADPVVAHLQRLEAKRSALALLRMAIERLGPDDFDLGALASVGPALEAALFVAHHRTGAGFPRISLPSKLLAIEAQLDTHRLMIAIGTHEAMAALAEQFSAQEGRKVDIPRWLGANRETNLALIAQRDAACEREVQALSAKLAELDTRHGLRRALADVARATWYFEQVGSIDDGPILSRMTGWTSDPMRIATALDASGARAMMHFPPPPPQIEPPLLLRNPRWVQPFELFSRLLGMPARSGADPSGLVAIVVPLLFGYMFGDVGQGVVLLIAGLALSRRMPALRLLVPGGMAAIAFGVMFGSLFSVEDIVPAYWIEPLSAPVTVLALPLVGGALLLTLGLLIGGMEAWWAREFWRWLLADAGLIAVYVGIVLAFVDRGALYLTLIGVAWQFFGSSWLERARPAAVGEAMPGETVCEVLESDHPAYAVGDIVLARAGGTTHATSDGVGLRKLDPALAPITTALGVLGMPGFAAYAGLNLIGKPRPGETMAVAAASGPAGSLVGQLARLGGGAGRRDRRRRRQMLLCARRTEVQRRRRPPCPQLHPTLQNACPDGIDVYFESVGGAVWQAVLPLLNRFARVPVCGLIAHYSGSPTGPTAFPLLCARS